MQTFNKQYATTGTWRIIWCSIGLGVFYWFIDCFTDVYIFKEGTLSSQIFSPHPHEFWMRSFTMIVLISLGILAQQIIKSNRKAENRIQDISLQWRTTFDAMEDSIFIADAEGRILRCNKAFANLVNRQASEILGRTCHEVVHGTADFIDGCPFITSKNTRQREIVELEAGNKWFSVTVDPILNDSGEVVSYVHSMSDITVRKQAERALKESEEKYKSVIENVGFGISVISPDMEILSLNSQIRKWFPDIDTSKKPICYKAFNNPPRENLCSYCPTCKTLIDGETHESITDTPVGDEIRNYRVISSSIKNAEGKVIAAIEMVDDITESRRAGEKLRTSEERFRSLAENIDQVFWFTELKPEQVLYVSPAFERIWGVPTEKLYGNPRLWVDSIHIDDRQHVQEAFEAFINSSGITPYKVEYRIKRQDDEIRWIYDRGTFIPTKEGQPQRISGVAEDITERIRSVGALKESEEQYRLLFQYSPIGVFHYTKNMIVTESNKRFAEIVHLAPEQIRGLDLKTLKVESVHSALNAAIKGEEGFYEGLCLLSPTPGDIWVTLLTAPHFDRQGDIKGGIGIVEDITERKQTQEVLAKTTETLQSLFQASPVAIILLDPYGNVTMWSHAAELIFGWKAEEVLGRFNPIVPEEKKDEFKSHRERILSGESFAGIEVKRLRKDGSYLDAILSTAPVYDQNGTITGIMGILTDITAQKKAEEALRKSEENLSLYQTLINQSNDSVEVIDPETGNFLNVSKKTCADLGYSREELLSMKVFDIDPIVKPSDFPKIVEELRRTGGSIWNGVHLRKDGSTFPVEVSLTLAQLDRSYLVAVARDITERKKSEEQIFQIKQDWEDTFNILTDMITVHDADFNIIRYNTAAEKILGLSFLNVKKEKCYQFYHGTECAPAGCPSCLTFKTGVPSTVELFEPHLNRFIEIRAIPRFDSEHNLIGLIHVVRDITEQRKIENHLRQSQKMEAVGQLAGGVAHDFNNIITAIIGYASIMKMKTGPDDSLRGVIDQVLLASEKAANLVRSLLAFSRKQISNPEPVRINDIIKSIEKLLSMAVGEDIELKIELTEDLIVIADIVQMEQVMMNLCTNARDAMPGRGTLTIKTGAVDLTMDFITAHGYGEEGRYALISVSDTGVGMDENTRERIFEPFFTTKEFGKGTGLGLSIVYGIIKQHKGYITCQSEPGKGTTFNIYLPVVKAAIKEIKRIELSGSAGTGRTILFAEDEEEFRKLTRQMLESSGYNVIEVVDGVDAVNKFTENNDIDLLLFDIIMPKMSGKEAYDRIRKIRPDVKALFISGYPSDFTGKYGVLEEGMNFISKPVTPAALLRKIIEALGDEAGK